MLPGSVNPLKPIVTAPWPIAAADTSIDCTTAHVEAVQASSSRYTRAIKLRVGFT